MGYTGGEKPDPTYHDLGNHAEALQVDFDPGVISYAGLLEVFWDGHDPARAPYSSQYKAAIFFHDAEQERLAVESAARIEQGLGRAVRTEIVAASPFTRAEDYHQKYRLRRDPRLTGELQAIYPEPRDFTDSTAAARLNGYLAGFGEKDELRELVRPLEIR